MRLRQRLNVRIKVELRRHTGINDKLTLNNFSKKKDI